MPGWTIELLAGERLTRGFWLILAMPVPFWLAVIFFPSSQVVRRICHPMVAPTILLIPLLYLYYQTWELGGMVWPGGIGYTEAQSVVLHPMGFLILWCQLQIMHLFLGLVLFQHACRVGLRIPGELIACWVLGPIGLLVYLVRLLIKRVLS
ncbi:abscisic acid-deficient protein Aba4 family protein [Ruficoccus sp. ZRK36]|uniref:abscisic acid-deficient protein Aba4 family protein n=1 Tax=Ruficoccus sp. ZRK36 TaxID=2866311 RepID=UPI001C72F28F|nr:abscisic acid-deficient protein Aba4 family protein [Ruficoccus sp. ZRK36]QYY36143.1 DUF4281 domain-containing protein [Ruficoccus sp. ZRK36]